MIIMSKLKVQYVRIMIENINIKNVLWHYDIYVFCCKQIGNSR